MEKVSVVGINGSPRKNGTTSLVLKKFLNYLEKYGAETHLINLIDYKINICFGCYSNDPKICKYSCWQKDDMPKIYPYLIKSDALIFATPVYWFGPTGLMKNFIDRLTVFGNQTYFLEGKVGIFMSVSKEDEGGKLNAALSMASALNHMGLFIPPYGIYFYPGKEKVVQKNKNVNFNWAIKEMPAMAKNLIKFCKLLKNEKFEW